MTGHESAAGPGKVAVGWLAGGGGQGPACRYFKNVAASASAGRNGRQQVRGTSTSVHILIISFHLRTTDTAHATRQRLTRTYCKNHKSCSTV